LKILVTLNSNLILNFYKNKFKLIHYYYFIAHPLHSLAESLLGKIRKRASNEDIQTYFKEMVTILPAMPAREQEQTIREIFVQCVLMQGCKSFSHVLNVIERLD
jgi:hypothetical protein